MKNVNVIKNIGTKVALARKNKSLSQMQLAESTDLNFNYISRIENGNANFTINVLKRIADALGVSISDFFIL